MKPIVSIGFKLVAFHVQPAPSPQIPPGMKIYQVAFLRGWARGKSAVVPGKPEASPLMRFVQDPVEDMEMPPFDKRGKFPALTQDQVAKLNGWIAQGAAWPESITIQAPQK